MTLREQYWHEENISRSEAVQKPLIEMTGYIKWLESKLISHNSDYEGDKLPKLPSLDEVRKEAAKTISGDGIVTAVYQIIERLGNFS
jgi:hypothetical protein